MAISRRDQLHFRKRDAPVWYRPAAYTFFSEWRLRRGLVVVAHFRKFFESAWRQAEKIFRSPAGFHISISIFPLQTHTVGWKWISVIADELKNREKKEP